MKTTNAIYIHTNTPTTDGVPTSMDNVNKQLLYDTAFFVTLKGGHQVFKWAKITYACYFLKMF